MDAELHVGCEGYINEGFTFCKSIQNLLLDLSKIKHTDNYLTLIKYLDHIKLFEKPCINSNVVLSCMYKVYELGYITENKYKLVCAFCQQHLRCCLKLELKAK